MIKHIVLFNVKEGEDKDAVAAVAARHLEPLVGQIPGLRHMEVRRCYAGMDYALYSEFDTAEDVKNIGPILCTRRQSLISIICCTAVYLRTMKFKQ